MSGASITQTETKDLVTFKAQTYGDWRDEFHRNGCVLIKGVISEERAHYYVQKQLQWLKSFDLGFDENDEATWTTDHLPVSFKGGFVSSGSDILLMLSSRSMYFGYAACHENMAWEARTEPKIIEIFEKLWGTNELITSFDGMNISLPRRRDLSWSPWPHCDQNQRRKG